MKTAFSDKRATAHVWAQRNQPSGREGSRGRIFFEGDTIYSYNRSFVIASFFDRNKRGRENETVCFLTTRTYSPTTSAHTAAVRSAASHYRIIRCRNPEDATKGRHADNMADFEARAHTEAMKLVKATKPEKYLDLIGEIRESAKVYAEFFRLSLKSKKFEMKYIFIESKDGGKKATAKEIAEIEKARKEVASRRAKILAKRIEDFLSGEVNRIDHLPSEYTMLRINKGTGEIDTSKGISIPFKEAKESFDTLKKLQKESLKGSDDFRGRGIRIFSYPLIRLDHMQFEVGCHRITFEEIDRIGMSMGWIYEQPTLKTERA